MENVGADTLGGVNGSQKGCWLEKGCWLAGPPPPGVWYALHLKKSPGTCKWNVHLTLCWVKLTYPPPFLSPTKVREKCGRPTRWGLDTPGAWTRGGEVQKMTVLRFGRVYMHVYEEFFFDCTPPTCSHPGPPEPPGP